MGLSLSPEKTRVVHMDSGFDFLGWRIQRRKKAGTNHKMVYTYPSKKSLHSIIGKVRFTTRRSGSPYTTLDALLKHLNTVVRGGVSISDTGSPQPPTATSTTTRGGP